MTESASNGPENDLVLDLEALLNAGIVVFHDEPGHLRRYGLSPLGAELAARRTQGTRVARVIVLDEACPACGSTAGVDAGARCLSCRVAWPPYM